MNMKEVVVSWKVLTCSDIMEIKSGVKGLFETRYNWKGKVSVALPLCGVIREQNVELCDEKGLIALVVR